METSSKKPLCFIAINTLNDVQAIRCAEFHPDGSFYAVGSNSKTLRICLYPQQSVNSKSLSFQSSSVIFKRTKHHKGSIYCLSWSKDGQLIATGSNDKTIKIIKYSSENKQLEGREIELQYHDGTVRDLCFLNDTEKTLLVSGGAGDCKVYVSDCCVPSHPINTYAEHTGHIFSVYSWETNMFVTGSQDKSVRFWDIRVQDSINTVIPSSYSSVTSVCVDPTGRLLVSGHEDACVLHDIRRNRQIQCFQPHSADIRSIRFSPSAYYLLTCGYDNKIVLTDLQGNLTQSLPSVVVGEHSDKVISARWHPKDFSILTTSADKTAKLWAIPNI
ncbi:WD repeat-containing protein 47 isoform X2 [Haematobia irritans]|uniref:WD repeat-containing protein 47 isoform X2 n=1 Tax=Haematobia irritans TaxID=7368 RepID=UPI003F4F8AD0